MLKSFFKFYLSQIVSKNNILLKSYLEKIKEQYKELSPDQRVNFNDIKQSISEMETDMEVDSESKDKLIEFLARNTDMIDVEMS